jgi:DNA repair exonuclease SbcCD ATPase subunit
MTEAELPPIYVTKEEWDKEQKEIEEKEARLSRLSVEWDTFVALHPGALLVSASDYAHERAVIGGLSLRIRRLWSDWGHYMAMRREALRRGEAARAAAYLGLIRSVLREIRGARAELSRLREEFRRKVVVPPELLKVREEMGRLEKEIAEEEERLGRKEVVVQTKLIAMHKRWFYESPRGKYHDISIEAVASVVVGPDEPKENYEEKLKRFMEDEMYKQPNFERLKELSERVEGFEERLVDASKFPVRGPELHTLEWWHAVFPTKQLSLEDFLPKGGG